MHCSNGFSVSSLDLLLHLNVASISLPSLNFLVVKVSIVSIGIHKFGYTLDFQQFRVKNQEKFPSNLPLGISLLGR